MSRRVVTIPVSLSHVGGGQAGGGQAGCGELQGGSERNEVSDLLRHRVAGLALPGFGWVSVAGVPIPSSCAACARVGHPVNGVRGPDERVGLWFDLPCCTCPPSLCLAPPTGVEPLDAFLPLLTNLWRQRLSLFGRQSRPRSDGLPLVLPSVFGQGRRRKPVWALAISSLAVRVETPFRAPRRASVKSGCSDPSLRRLGCLSNVLAPPYFYGVAREAPPTPNRVAD